MTIHAAATALYKSLSGDPAFFAVGVAEKSEFNPESRLVIYLREESKATYPQMYEGYPVEVTVSGPFAPL